MSAADILSAMEKNATPMSKMLLKLNAALPLALACAATDELERRTTTDKGQADDWGRHGASWVATELQRRGWVLRPILGWHHLDFRRVRGLGDSEKALLLCMPGEGWTTAEWCDGSGMSRRTFYRAKSALVNAGAVAELEGRFFPL